MLMAQLSALSRRKTSPAQETQDDGPSTITVRDLVLDFDRCQAAREDETIPLTPTEFKILAFLAKNAGKVVSPVEILRAVQDYTYSNARPRRSSRSTSGESAVRSKSTLVSPATLSTSAALATCSSGAATAATPAGSPKRPEIHPVECSESPAKSAGLSLFQRRHGPCHAMVTPLQR